MAHEVLAVLVFIDFKDFTDFTDFTECTHFSTSFLFRILVRILILVRLGVRRPNSDFLRTCNVKGQRKPSSNTALYGTTLRTVRTTAVKTTKNVESLL